MGSRTWIKVYCFQWIQGTLREETPDVRSVWIDLLTLSGTGEYGDTGEIKLANGVGYTDEQIAQILCIKKSLWRKAKLRLVKTERIEISPRGAISITNWSKYQSEYERQKPYRRKKAESSTPEPKSPYTPIDKETEIESERLQREVTTESYNNTVVEDTTVKDNIPITDNGSSASAFKATATLPKRETTIKDRKDTSTDGDKIEAFLRSHGLASIKAISQATGIGRNSVNTNLHNGKGKRFLHLPEKRAWDVAEKDNW